MSANSVGPFSDRKLAELVAQERESTAMLLAYLAEVDARQLHLAAGCPSLLAFCVEELRMAEDDAKERIPAARAARRFPALFEALADGRLHLSAVVLLAPHLTPENADDLIAAAAGKTMSEVELLLTQSLPLRVVEVAPAPDANSATQRAPGHVERSGPHQRTTPFAPDR